MRKRGRSSISSSSASSKFKKPSTAIDFSLNPDDSERRRRKRKDDDDDSIESDVEEEGDIPDSDDDVDSGASDSNGNDSDDSDEDVKESVETKKIRLARDYLSKMEQNEVDDTDSSDNETASGTESSGDDNDDSEQKRHDVIGKRLARQRMKKHGMLERLLADKVSRSISSRWSDCSIDGDDDTTTDEKKPQRENQAWAQNNYIKLCRGHDLTPTCVALNGTTGTAAFSASKDNSILMWDVERQIKSSTIVPRWNPKDCEYTRNSGEVLCMEGSDDGRYLAVGGRDATVKIYDVRTNSKAAAANVKSSSSLSSSSGMDIRGLLNTFEGHKGPITALAFRSQSSQLFSGSEDRCIRHYNVEESAYVETLYGHQAAVTGISCHGIRSEMPFSVGRDRTARAWKLEEDTHLIFRGGSKISSADCIAAIKDDWFLTGHEDGYLSLWIKDKKKPVASIAVAHGLTNGIPRGIVSCAALVGSDLTVTGSNDGYIRLWKASTGATLQERGLESIEKIPMYGYVNDIAIGPKGRFCVAAVGQEPRLGRWDRVQGAKNRFAIIQMGSNEASSDQENDEEDKEDDEQEMEVESSDSDSNSESE